MDDILGFSRCAIALPLDDLAGKEDVFKVEDREVVIFEFIRGVGGNNLAEGANQLAKPGDRQLSHARVYEPACADGVCWGLRLT